MVGQRPGYEDIDRLLIKRGAGRYELGDTPIEVELYLYHFFFVFHGYSKQRGRPYRSGDN